MGKEINLWAQPYGLGENVNFRIRQLTFKSRLRSFLTDDFEKS